MVLLRLYLFPVVMMILLWVCTLGTGTNTNNMPTHIDIDWGDGHSGLFYGTRTDNGNYAGYLDLYLKNILLTLYRKVHSLSIMAGLLDRLSFR